MVSTVASNIIFIILFVIGFYFYPPLASFAIILIFGRFGAMFLNAIAHRPSIVNRYVAVSLGIMWGAVLLLLVRSLASSVNLALFGVVILYLGGLLAVLYCGHSHALDVSKVIGQGRSQDKMLLFSKKIFLHWPL